MMYLYLLGRYFSKEPWCRFVFTKCTSSPADSRRRELSPYWPFPLRLGQTSPLFPLDENFFHNNMWGIKEYVCQVSSKSLENCDLKTGLTDRHPTKEKIPILSNRRLRSLCSLSQKFCCQPVKLRWKGIFRNSVMLFITFVFISCLYQLILRKYAIHYGRLFCVSAITYAIIIILINAYFGCLFMSVLFMGWKQG